MVHTNGKTVVSVERCAGNQRYPDILTANSFPLYEPDPSTVSQPARQHTMDTLTLAVDYELASHMLSLHPGHQYVKDFLGTFAWLNSQESPPGCFRHWHSIDKLTSRNV